MKKTIFQISITCIIIAASLLSSCDQTVSPGHTTMNWVGQNEYDEIRYFQDEKTLKCFAERGVNEKYAFTCVPCDSLVMVQINKNK